MSALTPQCVNGKPPTPISSTRSGSTPTATRRRESLGAREAAAGGGRGVLVQLHLATLDRLQERLGGDVVALFARLLGLHRRDPLGRHLPRVLLLDPRQPLGALCGLVDLDVDLAAIDRLVDLDE